MRFFGGSEYTFMPFVTAGAAPRVWKHEGRPVAGPPFEAS